MTGPIIEAIKLEHTYVRGTNKVSAVRDVTLQIGPREFVLVVGPSGSGKTTLLASLGLLLSPSRGVLRVMGNHIADDQRTRSEVRRAHFAMVFQDARLIPYLSASRNVEGALSFRRLRRDVRQQRARDQLIALGLGHRLHHLPAEMSAGEQQRTGLARALVTDPLLLLADEPTGNLDSGSSSEVFELLRSQVAAGRSVLMATHDLGAVPYASRVIRMSDGRVVADE